LKRTNAITLLIIAIIVIIIGGGLYWAQKTGKIAILGAFEGWPDVTPDDPAYEEMMAVGEAGWMLGYPDGLFWPNQGAARAEVVVAEVRARGDEVQEPTTKFIFSDVFSDHPAADYIFTAKELGIIDGYPDLSFQPDRPATRAELVIFIVKAKEYDLGGASICTPGDPSTYVFPDVPCDHPAYDYIAVAKEEGLIFGYPSGNFEPEQDATRRDLALILYRAFIQAGEEITISGQVTNSETSAAIPGATVNIVEAAEGTQVSDATDSTGAYQLRVVATSGSYTIRASASGYQSQTQGVTLDIDKTINFSLAPVSGTEGVISGRVRDAETSEAITGAAVIVLNYENGSQLADTTDSSGAYELRVNVTSGLFPIRASATGYNPQTLNATLSGGAATLNFTLSKITNEPGGEEPGGQTPTVIDGTTGRNVAAAATGAVLPIALVLLGTILSLFSLIYLLKTNKPEQSAQK